MKHVISTLAAPTAYVGWVHNAGLNTIEKKVVIGGGAGVAVIGGGQIIDTPAGVRTEVSDQDAAFLMNHDHFKEHLKRGFVKIVNRPEDPEKSAESMETDTGSAPKTPADVKAAAEANARKAEAGTPPLQAIMNKGK